MLARRESGGMERLRDGVGMGPLSTGDNRDVLKISRSDQPAMMGDFWLVWGVVVLRGEVKRSC